MRQCAGAISCHGLGVVDRENGVFFLVANIMYLHVSVIASYFCGMNAVRCVFWPRQSTCQDTSLPAPVPEACSPTVLANGRYLQ